MTESGFLKALRAHLIRGGAYYLKLNLRFMRGVPDIWLSGSKSDLWLEGKFSPTIPKLLNLSEYLSAHQQEWLAGRHQEGRNVGVVIGFQNNGTFGGIFLPGLTWRDAIPRETVKEKFLKTKDLANILLQRVCA